MATPGLTDPILLTRGDLTPNPKLTNQIATLGNVAFTRPKAQDPEKWLIPAVRFPNTQSVLDLVGKEGTIAVVLDQSRPTGDDADLAVEVQAGTEDTKKGKLVACSTIVPWAGGWDKEGAGVETGWEIKAVCVDGAERYLKKGLAIKVMDSLERHIIEKRRAHL